MRFTSSSGFVKSSCPAVLDPRFMAQNRLTTSEVVETIAKLGDRNGSRYTDVKNALPGNPTFFQVANVLARAKKDGIVKQNANGRWMLGLGGKAKDRDAMGSPSQLNRRRRRRSKGGKAKKKGKKGKKGGRRRRRGKKGKKGKKGKGRRRRRGKKGRKGKKGKKGKGRRRRGRKGKGKKK